MHEDKDGWYYISPLVLFLDLYALYKNMYIRIVLTFWLVKLTKKQGGIC